MRLQEISETPIIKKLKLETKQGETQEEYQKRLLEFESLKNIEGEFNINNDLKTKLRTIFNDDSNIQKVINALSLS
jgi:hypothetical protein